MEIIFHSVLSGTKERSAAHFFFLKSLYCRTLESLCSRRNKWMTSGMLLYISTHHLALCVVRDQLLVAIPSASQSTERFGNV